MTYSVAVYVFPKDPPPDPLMSVDKILEMIGRKRTGYYRCLLIVDEIPREGDILLLGADGDRLLVTETHFPFTRLGGDEPRFESDRIQPIKILVEQV